MLLLFWNHNISLTNLIVFLLLVFRLEVSSGLQQDGHFVPILITKNEGSKNNLETSDMNLDLSEVPINPSKAKTRSIRDTTTDYEDELEEIKMEEVKLQVRRQEITKRTQEQAKDNKNSYESISIINDIVVPPDYNIYEIPKDSVHGGPINVHVNFDVIKIMDFDEDNQIIKLDLELKVVWIDYKIMEFYNSNNNNNSSNTSKITIDSISGDEVKANTITLNNPYILDKIWKPNLFILNLISVRQASIMSKPLTIKYAPKYGWFEYITRIAIQLDCAMDFHYYPADTQTCEVSMRGFSYNKHQLQLNWYKTGSYLFDLKIPNFDAKIDELSHYDYLIPNGDPNDDVFDILSFKIIARRNLQYHLVQTYIASTFYIIITCLCFLLPPKLIEVRIGITMTTLLTLTAMFASVRESTPIVSYVKAIDIWMVGCICFVFLTLIQFTFYIWLKNIKDEFISRQEKLKNSRRTTVTGEIEISIEDWQKNFLPSNSSKVGGPGPGTVAGGALQRKSLVNRNPESRKKDSITSLYDYDRYNEETVWKYNKLAYVMESYSFIFFLSILILYSILYWVWLLRTSEYFIWEVNPNWNNI